MLSYPQSDRKAVANDAFSNEGKSAEERMAMYTDLMETVDLILAPLSPEERRRRLEIADRLQPRPKPWWKNFRAEALAEHQCQTMASLHGATSCESHSLS